ncbi:hypothetical protein MtrunA17_Chr1g0197781 [Medicago truncatula]|uniref:Uncharacterized protein n=1 Tax=Medicago truncatula TaxID=3880 RepID=I3SH04_MEDTR|nr:unknown [Medicago truncatula]RHN81327.1 hypothetical protein MtrunA17_Chr1g0197781 [Medicago truncatula]
MFAGSVRKKTNPSELETFGQGVISKEKEVTKLTTWPVLLSQMGTGLEYKTRPTFGVAWVVSVSDKAPFSKISALP